MKIVHLADSNGNIINKNLTFSWGFLFLGPIYLIIKLKFIGAFLLTILYYYILPIPGLEGIGEFILTYFNEGIKDVIYQIVMLFRQEPFNYIGIILCIALQVIISFSIEGLFIKDILKKGYLPITEQDARILISYKACDDNIKLAGDFRNIIDSENNIIKQKIIDVPYILNDNDNNEINKYKELEKNKKIDELKELYKMGLLTKEEFEIQRARIIKNYK